MRYAIGFLVLQMALLALPADAVIESYEFEDDNLLARYQTLTAELRCPKCQNQNIADSNAPIAADLRKQLHEQLHKGRSDDEIVEYMVQRYGEFVLYRPRFSSVTVILWLAPVLLLALAGWVVLSSLRGREKQAPAQTLSGEDQQRLQELLEEGGPGDR